MHLKGVLDVQNAVKPLEGQVSDIYVQYANLHVSVKTTFLNADEPKAWIYSHCSLSYFLFFSVRDLAELCNDGIDTQDNTIDIDTFLLQQLQQFSNHTSINHLNMQSMFHEFYVKCNTYQHHINYTIRNMVKDNHYLIEHVQMQGYKLDYENRNRKQCGGVVVL